MNECAATESPPSPAVSGAFAASAVVASAVALAIALALPTVTFRKIGSAVETYSIYGGIEVLWKDGNSILATIVFLFSIAFPVIKLVGLTFLCLQPRRPGRTRRIEWLQLLGKWSMLDVFIVALFIGAIRIGIASAASHPGIHVFAGSILLSMLAANLVGRTEARGERRLHTVDALQSWPARWVSLAASLALLVACFAPILEVRKEVLFGSLSFANEVRLLPTAWAMLRDGEGLLAASLLVLVVGTTAVRTLLALRLRWLSHPTERTLRVALRLDEWSMLAVFGLGLLIVRVKLAELATTELRLGFWAVLAASALAELDARMLRLQAAHREH